MALVKCPECGKEISEKATVCPNCGYKNRKQIRLDIKKIIIFTIILLVIGVAIFTVTYLRNSMPKELLLSLNMSREEVHNKIGNDFVLDHDKYGRVVEVYDLEWLGYNGKFSIAYSSSNEAIDNWKWEIDISGMSNQDVENAMIKIRDKISNMYGEPEESNVSRLEYKWITTHITKTKVVFDVGYKLIRDDTLWLHYGEVY